MSHLGAGRGGEGEQGEGEGEVEVEVAKEVDVEEECLDCNCGRWVRVSVGLTYWGGMRG